MSDVGSALFCLSEQKSELHLLGKVIVVLALVLGVGDPRQASIAQQSLIRVLAEGLRPAPGHGVQPFQGLPGCSEEKAPLWLERATFSMTSACAAGSSKNNRPQASTPLKVRLKNSEASTVFRSIGTPGNRARNAATIVGDASTA